jgi:hypothetical protein
MADHLNQCKNEARTAVFMDQIALIEEWIESIYTHIDLQKFLITYLRKQSKKRFHGIEGLPESTGSSAEDQE